MNLVTFIFASLPLLVDFYAEKYRQQDYHRTLTEFEADLTVPRIQTYDFIVIGAGTAGCVVAARLSQSFKVLLLESGGTPPPTTSVPNYQLSDHPATNRIYRTVPQENVGQERGGVLQATFGRMLGGSGEHNGMVYNRGSPYDYDNWARITGDPTWAYDSVLPYFKRAEDFKGVLFDEGQEEQYGYGGPMQVNTSLHPILPMWFEAATELGYDVGDPNARQRPSFTPIHVYVDEGKRVSTYNRYVKPILDVGHPNLTVIRYATVDEILIEDDDERPPTAYGVAYTRHGVAQRAYVSKEIILSAGVVGSPLLLMKSGVGPEDTLQEAGIPVKVALPGVGLNLQDHYAIAIGPIYVNDSSLVDRVQDGDEEAVLLRYQESGGGLLGQIATGPQALLASNRAVAAGEQDWPDWRININRKPNGFGLSADEQGSEDSWALSFTVGLLRSKDRGTVRLNTTAWRAGERYDEKLALIDMQFLVDPSDAQVVVEGIEKALNVFEGTVAFRRAGARYSAEPHADCLEYIFRSEEYWRCYLYWKAPEFWHMAGSCKMGAEEADAETVVDSRLKVSGVARLRVVDASVMSAVTNTNTNAPTIMIAEKASEVILREYDVDVVG